MKSLVDVMRDLLTDGFQAFGVKVSVGERCTYNFIRAEGEHQLATISVTLHQEEEPEDEAVEEGEEEEEPVPEPTFLTLLHSPSAQTKWLEERKN